MHKNLVSATIKPANPTALMQVNAGSPGGAEDRMSVEGGKMRKAVLGMAAFLFASAAAHAQQDFEEAPWADPLRRHMLQAENCVVAYFGEVTEHDTLGKYRVRTKVTCEDQRVFTVEQNGGPEQPFKILACNREGPSC